MISSLDDLKLLRDNVDCGVTYNGYYFAQTEDIFFIKDESWNPIGDVNKLYAFEGYYDGCEYTINDICCEDSNAGLFSFLGGEVRNLGIESGCFKGGYIGSITSNGTGSSRIINCYNKASLKGTGRVGGIADNYSGQILFSWNFGKLSGEGTSTTIAGISSYGTATIEYCYATESEKLVDISTYTGQITESSSIEYNEIDDIISNIYILMGEYKDSTLISYKNIIFPVVNDRNLTFSKKIIPLKFILGLLKGFYVEIFLVLVAILFFIAFLTKSIKHKMLHNSQSDLFEINQNSNVDEQLFFYRKAVCNYFRLIIRMCGIKNRLKAT